MTHIVLLGDSIFDNAPYVGSAPDVITQLRAHLPKDWQATLNAIDGSLVQDIVGQLERLPPDATHLILSVGGNNALGHASILDRPVSSSTQVFSQLADIRQDFSQQYRQLLQTLLVRQLPVTVCTIYNPNYPDAIYQRLATTALTIFNDEITQAAFQVGIPVIDLRLICKHPGDYANPIEPSAQGGEKIVSAILKVIAQHDFASDCSQVFC
jgi:hypothetical protein